MKLVFLSETNMIENTSILSENNNTDCDFYSTAQLQPLQDPVQAAWGESRDSLAPGQQLLAPPAHAGTDSRH